MKNSAYIKYINSRETRLFHFFNLAILALALLISLAGVDVRAAPPSLHPKLIQLLQLSESDPDQAIIHIEALQRQLPSDMSETDRRDLMFMQLQLTINKEDKPKAKKLIAELIQFGNQHHDQTANLMAINYQAKMLGIDRKYGEGLALIESTFDAVKKNGDGLLTNQIESTTAGLYSSIGNFKAALEHYLNALNASQTVKEEDWQVDLIRAKTLNSIGNTYLALKNDAMSLNYLNKARAVAARLNSPALLSKLLNDLAFAYADQRSNLAIETYQEVLALAKKLGNHNAEAKSLANLAGVSLDQKKYAECAQFAGQAIDVSRQYGLSTMEAFAEGNLGICHIYMGELQKGVAEHKRGMDFYRNANDKRFLVEMLSDLAGAYKNVGMYKDALRTLEERNQIKSEVFKTDRDRALAEMKVRFDLTQNQKEIEKLAQQNTLQQIEIENKNLQRILSVFIILSTVLAAVGLYFLYRKVHSRNLHLHATNVELKDQSTRDPLTGLLNRRAFEKSIAAFNLESDRRKTSDTGLHDVVVLMDIDHFKRINDTYGHPTGDCVLVEMGKRLQQCLREQDKLMRWGGEEFLIYLHQIHVGDVAEIIHRLLFMVGSTPFPQADNNQVAIPVTISAGYMLIPLPGAAESTLSWEQALKLVDQALYTAKSSGRNQALGIDKVSGTKKQVDALFEGDLEGGVTSGIIALHCVKGISQEEKVPHTPSKVERNDEVCL